LKLRKCTGRPGALPEANMLTIFSTPKPFRGHIGITQRNAIRSWTLLHPDAEVILFGDEEGTADAVRELKIRHEPYVKRNEYGTKYLGSIFDRAQQLARYDLLCYVNCDIILMSDFCEALESVRSSCSSFLMAGQRWDADIAEPLDFAQPDWELRARALALETNRQRPPQWIDYFAFNRGLYLKKLPPFVIGRPGWDNWLMWFARASGAVVVDASSVVAAVHQNHDYSYHADGEKGVWEGEEAQKNYAFLDSGRCFHTLENATHRLTPRGLRSNYRHWYTLGRQLSRRTVNSLWFGLLDLTRPVRHRLGLRQEGPQVAQRAEKG